MREAMSRCIRSWCSRCSSGEGEPVRSRTAQWMEQIGPSLPGHESSAQGGLSVLVSEEDSASDVPAPPVEVSSPGSAPVAGLLTWEVLRVWEQVDVRREVPGDSSGSEDSEAELIAQSVSRSGGALQSREGRPRRSRDPDGPSVVVDEDDWSALESGVPGRRYSGLRNSEAL